MAILRKKDFFTFYNLQRWHGLSELLKLVSGSLELEVFPKYYTEVQHKGA